MSNAQIWIAIILGFIVLITVASRFRGEEHSRTYRKLADKVSQGQDDIKQQLTGMSHELSAMHSQLDSLKRILEQVE